ncbi:hypothetical protein FRC09_008109, partial [Ceratobasidium sp. 395]
MSRQNAKAPSRRQGHPSWGIPIEVYLDRQPAVRGVHKYPLDQVTSAIQTFVAGDTNTLDDTTLESILSVVYYPEHLSLLNVKTVSSWFNMMEPYLKHHSLFDRSFGLLMVQVYGLAAMVAFLDHNKMLAKVVDKVSTDAVTEKFGVLPSLNLYTSRMANPNLEASGGTFVNYIRRFITVPASTDLGSDSDSDSDSDSWVTRLLPSIGGYNLKSALFFLKNIFNSRRRFLEVFDRVPVFGWFLILSLTRVQIWLLLESGEDIDRALGMLTELQDLNYRFYLIANTTAEHWLISSLLAEVLDDMSTHRFEDYVEPAGSADMALLSVALIRHTSPPSPETEMTTLSTLWEMFEWVDKMIQETGDITWYPPILASLFNRVWVELFSGLSGARTPYHNQIIFFSGSLLLHLGFRLDLSFPAPGTPAQGSNTPAQVISILLNIDFINLLSCILVHSVLTVDNQAEEREFTSGLSHFIMSFTKHTQLLKSRFEDSYPDWVNTSNHIRNLIAGLSTVDHVSQQRLEECQTLWIEFGELFGYDYNSGLNAVPNCCYARCAGVESVECKMAKCA